MKGAPARLRQNEAAPIMAAFRRNARHRGYSLWSPAWLGTTPQSRIHS